MGMEKCEYCGEEIDKRGKAAHLKACMRKQGKLREKGENKRETEGEKKEIVEQSRGKDSPATQHEIPEPSKNVEKETGKNSPASDSETGEPHENIIYGALAAILAILVAAIGILYLWWKGKEGKTNA